MTLLFFSVTKNSVTEVIQIFEHFTISSGLKPKCEIAGIGVLKGVQMALCGMDYVNLKNNTIKILGIHFPYNRRLENMKTTGDIS